MNRLPSALLASLVGFLCVAPAQAQVCPWGMHAQVQMQIQWQHQQTLQQQIMQHLQTQIAHQQAMQQHLIAQVTAAQQHQQAMQARLVAQMQHNAQNQLSVIQARNQQYQRLLEHQRTLSVHMNRTVAGHGSGHANPFVQWQLTESRRMQQLTKSQTLHRVTHLQNITSAQRLSAQRSQSASNAARHAQQLALARRPKSIPIHRPQSTTQHKTTASSRHSPSVKVRASMSVSCGQCHQGHAAAPTVALKPPSTPFKTLLENLRRPQMPKMIAGQVRPGMPKAMVQLPRQPLLPFVASGPTIQPIVRLPRTTALGQVPLRVAMVAPVPTPPLGPIALLQPPPLPALMNKPLNLMPLLPTTESTPATSVGGVDSPGDSSATTTSPGQENTLSQLASTIVKSKPSTGRRDDDRGSTLVSPEMVRRAPPLPVLDVRYPLLPLLAASGRPAPSAATKPSLVEVVLQSPPLPSLPEPVVQSTPVP